MISLKRLMDSLGHPPKPSAEVLPAALQTIRLLLGALGESVVLGPEPDPGVLRRSLQELLRRLSDPPTSLSILSIGSDAVESLEDYTERSRAYYREQALEMQAIVAMLTNTIAEVSGHADASIARLHAIESRIETATEIDDMRTLSANLEGCLTEIREAAAHQRRNSATTIKRLRDQIDAVKNSPRPTPAPRHKTHTIEIALTPEPEEEAPPEATPIEYVAAFKLQRAEHIESRFGESAKHQMLSLISRTLKAVLGPNDRLLRWEGKSFVMFLTSTGTIADVRAMLSEAVAKTGQHYIEVGKKSALLSVGIDWIVFPQAQCTSLDAVFEEVDAFLAAEPGTSAVSRLGELR